MGIFDVKVDDAKVYIKYYSKLSWHPYATVPRRKNTVTGSEVTGSEPTSAELGLEQSSMMSTQ